MKTVVCGLLGVVLSVGLALSVGAAIPLISYRGAPAALVGQAQRQSSQPGDSSDGLGRATASEPPFADGSVVSSTPSPLPVVTLAATSQPLPAPVITATPEASPTPSPTIAPQASPTLTGLVRTVFEENFADNQRNWPNDPQGTAWLADGAYRLADRQPGQFVAIRAPAGQSFRDLVVMGTFRKVGGPAGGYYGLIVRDEGSDPADAANPGARYYVLAAGDRGEISIWHREGDRSIDLLPWVSSGTVHIGDGANQLAARVVGQRLTFLVNGIQVAEVLDPEPRVGGVGIYVAGDSNEVALNQFVVQVIE